MLDNPYATYTFTPSNGSLEVDAENRLVSYSGSGRWTGVYIEKLTLTDDNGKNITVDTDIEITGKMPQGGRYPYFNTHNGAYPIFLDENNEFKIRTRYRTSQRIYIGIIDGQMGGWDVTLQITDIKVFKQPKQDSELDIIPNKLTVTNQYTSVLLGDSFKHEPICPTGTFESMTLVSETPNIVEVHGDEVKAIANGTGKFHIVNKYGIGQYYSCVVVDYINIKAISSRKVLPVGQTMDYRTVVAPTYVTQDVHMEKPNELVIENGTIRGTSVGDFDIKYSINRNGITMEKVINFKIVDNGENVNNIYRMKKQNLQVGDTYTTDGYYYANDGGQATYDIMTLADYTATLHEDVVKANVGVDGFGNHMLDNGLVARIKDGVRLVEQFGVIGDGVTDDCEPLNHLFGQTKTGEIRFGQDKVYAIYGSAKANPYGSVLPQSIGGSAGAKPTLGNIKDVVLEGNNSTILIPENEFASGTNEFGVINLLGEVDGLEIKNFTFLQNGLTQYTYLDDNAEVKSQMTRGHGISYTGGKFIHNVNIHHNKFYECGTTINSNDCGGDFILIINPTASENVFIEDNEFYDWGRWVFSVDLGGSGERFYNYKFNRNKCVQTVNNYLRYRADKDTYRSLRGLGWIDFEARKCWTGLEVCDNFVEGACGFAINGNGKVTRDVVVRGNVISRPDYNSMRTEEEIASGLEYGWRGVYNYGFNWYSMYGENVLFEDNVLNYGGVTMVQGHNVTYRNNICADWVMFGGYPMFGEIILDGNNALGSRCCVMNFNFSGTPHVDFMIDEPYTHVLVNNHTGGGFYASQRGAYVPNRPVKLEFTGDNYFNKMDLNVFGLDSVVEFNPQWMNPDKYFAIRGAKFTAPTTRKYNLSRNWKVFYTGYMGGGLYNEGELVYEDNDYLYVCTESGYFPTQASFLLVDDHENDYEGVVNSSRSVNQYIFTPDNAYIVTVAGTTGTLEEFPHHTEGTAMWGEVELRHLAHVGKAEQVEKDKILPIDDTLKNNVPQLTHYYIRPTLKTGEDNVVSFYVTDSKDLAYLEENDEYRYKIIITRQDKEDIVLYNLKAGEHTVNLGSYDTEGEYEFSIIACDQYGRFSPEIFNFIRVSNGRVNNTYHVTEQDLIDYGIKYNNNREIQVLVDCSDIFVDYTDSNERIAKMKERTAKTVADYNLPKGHYVVAIPDREGTGVYQGKHKDGKNYQAVRYANGYDKEAVELECNETRLAIQKLLNDKRAEGYNHVIMYKALYFINANEGVSKKEQGIRVPNGMDLDLNGSTIKLNAHTGCSTIMLHISDSEDTHLHNGIIEGDYFSHDYANSASNSEWVSGVEMGGKCKYCSIYDLVIKDITGYGLQNGLSQRGEYGYTEYQVRGTGVFTRGIDIDQTTGEEITNEYRSTSEMINLWIGGVPYKYVSCSRYLGYQGNALGTWNMILHFYDKDKKFIKSVNAHKYHRVRVPDGGWYIRTTILNNVAPTNLSYQYFNVPTHCEFKNIQIDNVRCVGCAPSQMKDILFENIEISNSGQASANCALDAEDGWDGMQDVTFRNMIFHDNPLNNWLVCAGHNFIIEDSPNITAIYAWGRCKGLVVKNTHASQKIYVENKGNIPRFYNTTSVSWNAPGILRNCDQTISSSIVIPVENCNLNITSSGNINNINITHGNITLDNWSGYINTFNCNDVDFYGVKDEEIKFSFNHYGSYQLPIMSNCRFHHNTNFANHTCFMNGLFVDCEFNELFSSSVQVVDQAKIDNGYHGGITYTNCKFHKVTQFAQLAPHAYSSGRVLLTFENCEFTFTDEAKRMFLFYSCPINGSVVKFRNCKFNNMDGKMLAELSYCNDKANMDITFEFENCEGLTETYIKESTLAETSKFVVNIK